MTCVEYDGHCSLWSVQVTPGVFVYEFRCEFCGAVRRSTHRLDAEDALDRHRH